MIGRARPTGRGSWWRTAAEWLRAGPTELVGLAVLLAGSAVAAALVWTGGATAPHAPQGTPGQPVGLPSAKPVRVHVAGAVHAPGLVTLAAGSRVEDAVAAAGGALPHADLDAVNLARVVEDGEQVAVPVVAPAGAPPAAGAPEAGSGGWVAGRLDLNRASTSELEELPGIGPVLAERIVAWRDEQGRFDAPGDLRDVPGIGERTFQLLADLVTV